VLIASTRRRSAFCNFLRRPHNLPAMGISTSSRGHRVNAIALLTFITLAGGCSHPPKVTYQYDAKADFSKFKTYAMEPTQSPTLSLRELDGKPVTQVLQQSIEQQLSAKGLHNAASSSAPADLRVRWTGQIEDREASGDVAVPGVNLDVDTPDGGAILDYGPSGEGVPYIQMVGGVRVDLIDAQTNQIVWRGGVGMALKRGVGDPQRIERLNAAIAMLFANYPPKPAPAR